MDNEIIEVGLVKDGFFQSYRVGISGVTKIVRQKRNGEMAEIDYFEILGQGGLVAALYQYSYVRYD